MASSLKLANLWRVIRDVDLERMRAAARTPFELVVVGEDAELTGWVRVALGAVQAGGVHPYVVALDPEAMRARPTSPVLAILVTRTPELSVAMKGADEACIRMRTPRLTLVVGDTAPAAAAPRFGEQARVAVIDPFADAGRVAAAAVPLIEGDTRLAVAAALPVFRLAVADAIVDETAKANASFAVTTGLAETIPVLTVPLNLGDMVILTKNQLVMGYRISLAAGRDGDPRSMMTEVLGVLGGGLLFRQAARQLVGLIPVAGLLPKVAIAYGGTYAMGRALTAWALGGSEVTSETVARYSSEGLERGRALGQQLLTQVHGNVPAPGRRWQRLRGWLPSRRDRQLPPPGDA